MQWNTWKEFIPERPVINESWDSFLLYILCLPLIFFISVPLVALLAQVPFASFITSLQDGQVLQATMVSLLTSTITALVTLLVGTPVAFQLARRGRHGRNIVDTIIDLPTVLPPAVAGVALLMAFGRRGLIGAYLAGVGITIPFTQVAVVMAQTFVSSPFYVKAAVIGFSNIRQEYIEAASLDGAGRLQTFIHIILPLAKLSILSGCVMTWARALGEFGATIIFAGNFPGRTQTMPLAIYVGFEMDLKTALTLSFILICCSFVTLVSVKMLMNRNMVDTG